MLGWNPQKPAKEDVHALAVSYVVGCYNAVATGYGLSCMQKLWSAQAVLCLYMACYSVIHVVKY